MMMRLIILIKRNIDNNNNEDDTMITKQIQKQQVRCRCSHSLPSEFLLSELESISSANNGNNE